MVSFSLLSNKLVKIFLGGRSNLYEDDDSLLMIVLILFAVMVGLLYWLLNEGESK